MVNRFKTLAEELQDYSRFIETQIPTEPTTRKFGQVTDPDVTRGEQLFTDISKGILRGLSKPIQIGITDLPKVFSPVSEFLLEKPAGDQFLEEQRRAKEQQELIDSLGETVERRKGNLLTKGTLNVQPAGALSAPGGLIDLQDQIKQASRTSKALKGIGVAKPSFQSDIDLDAEDYETISKRSPGDKTLLDEQLQTASDEQQKVKENLLQKSLTDLMGEIPDDLSDEEKTKRMEQYKQDFYSATGINPSGKPDMKDAMVAFGLALMQNKAGKKLDIGKIFSAVGEAGEKALPLARQAKKEARDLQLKAAQYALGRSEEDRKKLNERKDVLLVKKSPNGFQDTLNNIPTSRFENLSLAQINNLNNNEEFKKNFLILDAEGDLLEKAMEKPEIQEIYSKTATKVALFDDAPESLQISVFNADPNVAMRVEGGINPYFNQKQHDMYYERLKQESERTDAVAKDLEFIINLPNEKLRIPGQLTSSLINLSQRLGINIAGYEDRATDKDKAQYILSRIGAQEAANILQEAGRTISDRDRERVEQIIGTINLRTSPQQLKFAVEQVYDILVKESYRDISQGLQTLNRYSNKNLNYTKNPNDFSFLRSPDRTATELRPRPDGTYEVVSVNKD
tara:strand:- start:1165 stop:3039 length:1875 start_codon:yes stop_codon:yes gene_type:complete